MPELAALAQSADRFLGAVRTLADDDVRRASALRPAAVIRADVDRAVEECLTAMSQHPAGLEARSARLSDTFQMLMKWSFFATIFRSIFVRPSL